MNLYGFNVYLFACWEIYSILGRKILVHKTHIVNKLFLFFISTMASSGFGPYHGLWRADAPSKHIDITPTSGAITHVLGLGTHLLKLYIDFAFLLFYVVILILLPLISIL